MKRISQIIFAVIISMTSIACAASYKPSQHIHLFYKVDDNVLLCQNKEGDTVKSKAEWEREIREIYKNRFIVDKVSQLPMKPELSATDYLQKVKPGQTPFIVMASFQNYHGEHFNTLRGYESTKEPTIIDLAEFMVDKDTQKIYGNYYKPLKTDTEPIVLPFGFAIDNPRKFNKNYLYQLLESVCNENTVKKDSFGNLEVEHNIGIFKGDFKTCYEREETKIKDLPDLGFFFTGEQDVYVKNVTEGGPYEKAGGMKNDDISKVDGIQIKSSTQLQQVINSHKPGDSITMEIVRAGRPYILNVVARQGNWKMYSPSRI